MRFAIGCFFSLALSLPASADDWAGKSVRVKADGLKLGRKFGSGLVRDGAALDPAKAYSVKSDDGTYLEIEGGFLFKSEAEVAATPEVFPKAFKKEKEGDPPVPGGWAFGTMVMFAKPPAQVPFGDWVEGKQVEYPPGGNILATVRKDNGDGWVRVANGTREGWVAKRHLVAVSDVPAHSDRVLKANPRDTHALQMRGLANCWFHHDLDKALADYSECIRLEPGNATFFLLRGQAWTSKWDQDKAIADISESIKLDPRRAEAYDSRAYVWCFLKRDYDKAIADYTEAIKLDPKQVRSVHLRGNAWMGKKEYDKAIADYTEAIRLAPKDVAPLQDRGAAWMAKKDSDKAIADYTEAIKLNPKEYLSFLQRGGAWRAKKDYDKAIADYTEAIKLGPKNPVAYFYRGGAWVDKRDFDMAIADYTETIKLEPKNPGTFLNRGSAWMNKNEYDKAIADYTEAIKLQPNNAPAIEGRSEAWFFKAEYQKSLEDYNALIRLKPKDATAHASRATVQAKLKKYDAAVNDFEKAIELSPAFLARREYARFRASCPNAKFRDGAKALELAKAAIQKLGASAGWKSRDALAMAHAEAGDFAHAVAEQKKAIDLLTGKGPTDPDAGELKAVEARLELYKAKKPYRDE